MNKFKLFVHAILVVYFYTLIGTTANLAFADGLSSRSDTISNPVPNTASNHTIRFTTTNAIPASGKIIITPSAGNFNISAGLDYTDLDLKINNVDQNLADTPGTGNDSSHGVIVTSGNNGNIVIVLNDTNAIAGSSQITIDIGTTAVYGNAGDAQITNPSSIGPYTIAIATKTNANTDIDSGSIGVSINNTVGVSSDTTPGTVATPIINPSGGTFTTSVSVTISTTTPGAFIYYTTDGSVPSSSSNLYSSAITINSSTTLKAIGILTSYTDSNIASATFIIQTPGGAGAPGQEDRYGKQPTKFCVSRIGDLNCDTKVNLIDLSILFYYWDWRQIGLRADLNKDGIVNIVDMSIMFYWWTD